MQVVTDVQVTAGVLTITRATLRTDTGVPILVGTSVESVALAPAFYTHGAGDPPTDGTILTEGYWNDTLDEAWVNTAYPTTSAPTWEAH